MRLPRADHDTQSKTATEPPESRSADGDGGGDGDVDDDDDGGGVDDDHSDGGGEEDDDARRRGCRDRRRCPGLNERPRNGGGPGCLRRCSFHRSYAGGAQATLLATMVGADDQRLWNFHLGDGVAENTSGCIP